MTLDHRVSEVAVTISDAQGRPLAGVPVTIRQVRHKFLFGCNAYMLGACGREDLEQAYRRRFANLLNYATLPFYWGSYEPEEGKLQAERLTMMARWCADNAIRAKGHPLCWHEVVPKWLPGKPVAEVEMLQWGRITRDVGQFAGRIDTWDVINETVATPAFKRGQEANPIVELCLRMGQVALIAKVFDLARRANPAATLILNDYDTSEKCERLIEQCLQAGVPVDVIGIQSHMHKGYWGREKAEEVCRRFARFGKPLHFTEATIVSGALKTDDDWHGPHPGWDSTPEGEQRQAEQAEEFYRTLFAQPGVEGITWWDFADLGAWQGAPAGFLRKDLSPKPAYQTLTNLIRKEWWTGPLKLTADARGQVRFRGFVGAYALKSGTGAAAFDLTASGASSLQVQV